ERHDGVELAADLGALHAKDRAVEVHVIPPGELGMKAGADLEQRANAAPQFDLAGGRRGDARQELEEGTLSGAVAADDADNLARIDVEADVAQCPHGRLLPLLSMERAQRRADPAKESLAEGPIRLRGADAVLLADTTRADRRKVHQTTSAKLRST